MSPPTGARRATSSSSAGADHPLRLTVKPPAPVTGFVDGAWWPYSRDLPAELPALLAELKGRLGGVERVSYNLDDWGLTVRRISVDGALVRLAGYRSQHPDTVDLNRALQRAGQPGDTTGIEELLTASSATGSPADEPAGSSAGRNSGAESLAEQRWELDGGHVARPRT